MLYQSWCCKNIGRASRKTVGKQKFKLTMNKNELLENGSRPSLLLEES